MGSIIYAQKIWLKEWLMKWQKMMSRYFEITSKSIKMAKGHNAIILNRSQTTHNKMCDLFSKAISVTHSVAHSTSKIFVRMRGLLTSTIKYITARSKCEVKKVDPHEISNYMGGICGCRSPPCTSQAWRIASDVVLRERELPKTLNIKS